MFNTRPPREEWEHLMKYGYAPGDYMIRCSHCKEQIFDGCDKRATSCKPCSEKLFKEDQEKTMTAVQVEPTKEKTIIKFKYFETSEEFEDWQLNNSIQLINIVPIVNDLDMSYRHGDQPDFGKYTHLIFVTYVDQP